MENLSFRHRKCGFIVDIVSPTGSGKTLAYFLPIFDLLKKQEEQA